MNRRTFLASTATVALAPAVSSGAPKEKVKIVSSLPRVDGSKVHTDQIANGIRMALADFEKAAPFEVQYLDWDDATAEEAGWTAEREKDNAENAIADKDVMAVIGPYNSGAARVSAPILNRAGLVQITPSASWPGLTKKGPSADADEPERYRPGKRITFCRVCPHDDIQGPLSADFAADDLKAKTVYILDDKQLYGQGTALAFKKRCDERKIQVLAHESIDTAQIDFQALMKKIKKAEPDLVYFGGTTQSKGGQIAKDMHSQKVGCPLMLPDGCYEDVFVRSAGAAVFDELKCFVTIIGIDPAYLKGAGGDLVKRYKEKYQKEAEAYAVYGYEAAAVVLEALRAVGKKDREAVRKAVVGTTDFDKGFLGKWSFDADGDTTHQPLTVATVGKGAFKSVKVMGTK